MTAGRALHPQSGCRRAGRRFGLVGLALLLAACGGPGSGTPTGPASPEQPSQQDSSAAGSPTPASPNPAGSSTPGAQSDTMLGAPRCADLASGLSLPAKVGQLYMAGVTGEELSPVQAQALSDLQVGSVILMGPVVSGSQAAADLASQVDQALPGVWPLLATDQEGGQVQRLQGPGFAPIPDAQLQATQPAAQLQADWATWGGQLKQAGVSLDLAPVADVVPASMVNSNAPIAQLGRGYGSDPAQVSADVAAVVQGLAQAQVASSVKHFPGLGQVTQNTDFAVAHDQVTTGSAADLASFQAGINAGASSVMISSVIYDRIDPGVPAVFSSVVITDLLRDQLGFDRVVISDDLGSAAAVAGWPASERGSDFLRAGGDLVVNVDPAGVQLMIQGTLAAAEQDPGFAASLDAKVARVLRLKASVGLLECR